MSRPVVYLFGQPVADAWNIETDGELVAVDGISIPWGRDRLADTLDPHVATVRLIDTSSGDRFVNGLLLGAVCSIRREGPGAPAAGITLLHGLVTEQTARPRRLIDPTTGLARDVIEITLRVGDTAAALSTIVRHGPYDGMQLYGQGGVPTRKVPGPWCPGGWDQQWPQDRLASIMAAPHVNIWCPTATVGTGRKTVSDHPARRAATTNARPALAGIPSSELRDVWTMLCEVYAAAEGLGWPSVRPGERITQGQPAECADITLVTSGGWLTVQTGMQRVSAAALQLDGPDAYPSASIADMLGQITTELSAHVYRWQDALDDAATGRRIREDQLLDEDLSETITVQVNNSRGQARGLQLALAAGASRLAPPSPATTVAAADEAWNGAIGTVQQAAARAEQLNDWMRLPPLRYRPDPGSSENTYLLQTWETGAVWITGSKWADILPCPRAVQIIGGTLTWRDNRWDHEMTTAPVIDRKPRDLTWDELFSPVNTTVSRFHPDLTLADLMHVTRRTAT